MAFWMLVPCFHDVVHVWKDAGNRVNYSKAAEYSTGPSIDPTQAFPGSSVAYKQEMIVGDVV